MRLTERLTRLKEWTYSTVCEGRSLKAPGEKMNLGEIVYREPKCYLGWAPARRDQGGLVFETPDSVCPGIIIMPNQAYTKRMEEKRFDRYNHVSRPKELGQQLSVSVLFGIYEPGIRLPGFAESAAAGGLGLDLDLMAEGTEQGLYTLLDWMDDFQTALIREKMIPHTDLFVDEEQITYGLYVDQNYVVDRRPLYYGFVNVLFGCYANEGVNPPIDNYLV